MCQLCWCGWCRKALPSRLLLLHPMISTTSLCPQPGFVLLTGSMKRLKQGFRPTAAPSHPHSGLSLSQSNPGHDVLWGIADGLKISLFPSNFYVHGVGQALLRDLSTRLSAFFPNAHRHSLFPVPAPQTSPISPTSVFGKHVPRLLAQPTEYLVKASCLAFCEVPTAEEKQHSLACS